jgi:DNA-binding response OmpR family regulator
VLKVGGLELHLDKYQTKVDGKPVALTTKEFEICALLASQPGKVFSREQIQEHIWGDEQFRDSNNITVFVRKIREKLEADPSNPRYILTVQRAGYKMAEDLTQDSAS